VTIPAESGPAPRLRAVTAAALAVTTAMLVLDLAWLGVVANATCELTNRAVLRDWPAWIVPVDVAWGVA